ncbi:nitrate reductase molybdenum cofactor assembly chaperone [Vulcanibacillus modesticaldus]|uniref:Nitrate reductase molybdenum cofactor assembly chaperone n=1 Tax=Vulcanibacillus modesticaldus TaxID=337097 RepID=A0A1D2YWN7_9BACI|nr:nitrate reductase molybdenum cofactor assembly chaperone [Vulcanibacillus modesticaldus]OEG00027.1 nitrate reductase molybdenum cofactor assembly chaperone [Vulcanibacillus modesticaldus]
MENREILRLISLLLQYPEPEWVAALLEDDLLEIADNDIHAKIKKFLEYLRQHSIDEIQEKYVQTFDFNEKTNLYLTYAIKKDEKERGELLISLKKIYEDHGLEMDPEELPDYLPLILEFISIADEVTTEKLIEQFSEPINQLQLELSKTKSPYAELLSACQLTISKVVHR